MKKLLFILTLFFSTTVACFAQETDEPAEDKGGKLQERMQEYIQKRLNMTKAESEKFAPIFLRYMTELRKTHREFKTDRPMLQLKVAELRVKFRDEFKPVFGEQRANDIFKGQLDFTNKLREEVKERIQNKRQGGGIRRTKSML